MDKNWSEMNKEIQVLLSKEATMSQAIEKLIAFRADMFEQIRQIVMSYPEEAFWQMPFAGADGYHSKTIAYSIWHIFRIEDIVAHTLINRDAQIFFSGNYKERINSPIITTGNELVKNEIADFSKQLDIDELYAYISEVIRSTENILQQMPYEMLKQKIPAESRESLQKMNVVSSDEKAVWLIDYWCSKDIRSLIQMPFSRHWIMHIEASLRIKSKIRP